MNNHLVRLAKNRNLPFSTRLAAYEQLLAGKDWFFYFAEKEAYETGRIEDRTLRILKQELDPDSAIWNRWKLKIGKGIKKAFLKSSFYV